MVNSCLCGKSRLPPVLYLAYLCVTSRTRSRYLIALLIIQLSQKIVLSYWKFPVIKVMPSTIKSSSQSDSWIFELSFIYPVNSLPERENLEKKRSGFEYVHCHWFNMRVAVLCNSTFLSPLCKHCIDQRSALCDELHPMTSRGICLIVYYLFFQKLFWTFINAACCNNL